jgi:hypothetical protein
MGRLVYMRKELDDLCATMMSADVYQAVRRINRKGRQTTQIFLFTSAKCLVKTIVDNMPDIQVREIRLPCQKDTEKNCSGKSNVENPLQIKLKLLLMELADGKHREYECRGLPGHFKKGWCMVQIGCNGHFSRQLNAVQDEMLRLGITQDQHKLIVLKYAKD